MKTTPATWLNAEWRKTMKLCLLICVIVSPDVAAQNAQKATRKLPEIVAHYKKLAQFSRDSVSSRAHLDTIAFPASAGSATSKVALTLPVVYLDDIPELMLIPSPPPNSSQQVREELDYLLRVQQSRSPREIEAAKELAELYFIPLLDDTAHPHYSRNDKSLFYAGSSMGEWFNASNLPELARVLRGVHQDASRYYYHLKYHFNRPRPYQLDPLLQPLEQAGSPAYPSSHAAAVYVSAYLLSELEKSRTNEFLTKAFVMAHSREVLGVDYPSDAEAARLWAREFVNYLLEDPDFQADLKTIQNEWKQARKRHKGI